jgi:hypothetical protein
MYIYTPSQSYDDGSLLESQPLLSGAQVRGLLDHYDYDLLARCDLTAECEARAVNHRSYHIRTRVIFNQLYYHTLAKAVRGDIGGCVCVLRKLEQMLGMSVSAADLETGEYIQ